MNVNEIIDIEKARLNKVVKDNSLIQMISKRKYALTVVEQKIIAYIISMIKPDATNDEKSRCLVFDIRMFCKVCGIDADNGTNYRNLKACLTKLATNQFWIKGENGDSDILFQWISVPEIFPKSGKIEIEIPKKIMPYLQGLKGRFTAYEYYNVLGLTSCYSFSLYELLLSYAFTKKHTFEVEELKNLIQCPYKQYRDVRRYAIEPAIKEINALTDLCVSWESNLKGRKCVSITFRITKKTSFDVTMAQRRTLEVVNGIKHIDGQINLFEYGVTDKCE